MGLWIIVGIVVLVVSAGMYSSYLDERTGLQIESISPSPFELKSSELKSITLNLQNYGDAVTSFEISAIAPTSSEKYLKINNQTKNEHVEVNTESRDIDVNLFESNSWVGNEITYNVKVFLKTDEHVDEEDYVVKILPRSSEWIPYDESNNSGHIKFQNFNTEKLELIPNETDSFKFIVKPSDSFDNNAYENLRVDVFVEYGDTEFLQVEGIVVQNPIRTITDTSGDLEIPVTVLKSEGDFLKYNVHLTLYNNNIQLDSKVVEIIITPDN